MARPTKSTKRAKRPPDEPSELDTQIIAALADSPGASSRDIAEAIECHHSTVLRRMEKWPDLDWYAAAKRQCKLLLPRALANYQLRLRHADGPGGAAAHDLLFGLGILASKSEVRQTNIPASADEVVAAFRKLLSSEQDRVIAELEGDPGGA